MSVLAAPWRLWILEHLARGLLPSEIAAHLTAAGIDKRLVDSEIAALAPALVTAFPTTLRRALGGTIRDAETWPEGFWQNHWEANRPFVIRGHARGWPALERWTFSALGARFGAVPIQVEVERTHARHHEGRWVEATLDAFLADIATTPGNDRYAVARNHNIRRPELASLFDDIVVDETIFDRQALVGATSLWLGPAGTLTPLHFDTTNILFIQIVGRKRFELVSPHVAELFVHLDGFYVEGDLARVDPDDVHTVTLEPGDALFLPVGWFHRVSALDASISFSLLAFRRPNNFSVAARALFEGLRATAR